MMDGDDSSMDSLRIMDIAGLRERIGVNTPSRSQPQRVMATIHL
jgi:hypothetical protein